MTRQLSRRLRKLEATALAVSSVPVFRVYSDTGAVLFDSAQHLLRARAQADRTDKGDDGPVKAETN